jgi:subtilase family serine protease
MFGDSVDTNMAQRLQVAWKATTHNFRKEASENVVCIHSGSSEERYRSFKMRCLRSLLAVFSLLFFSFSLVAQSPESAPRITARVDNRVLVALPGNVHPNARAEFDRGLVTPDLPMGDLYLVLRRSPDQQKAFEDFVASQYNSSSPNFHQWLTPDEIGSRFGPALADIQTISAWLTSQGFSIDEVSKDRMSIRFSGKASQVQAAFHTEIHNLMVRSQPHIANMSDPKIPAALGPVVLGIKALHNFLPRPLSRIGSPVRLNPETRKWERIAPASSTNSNSAAAKTVGGIARPQFGITVGTGSNAFTEEDLVPYDWATIYNVLPLWNASSAIDGTGQKIAIAGTSNINLSDVATFRSTFGLPANVPTVTVTNSDPGVCADLTSCDQVENTLDVEWSGAIAKGAKIILVTSKATTTVTDPLTNSVQYIINNSVAPIVSVSYGLCELGLGTAGNTMWANTWKTAAAAGMSVFVATGDSGAATCDAGGDAQFGTPYAADFGNSVNGIGSTPDNTAVGGTDLNWGATFFQAHAPAPYWNTSNASNGSSAIGYIPEVPWNGTCTNPLYLPFLQDMASQITHNNLGNPQSPTNADTACNFVVQWYQTIANHTNPSEDISFLVDTVGAGGGSSTCTTNDSSTVASCSGGYSQPDWQVGVSNIPTDGKRAIPDVSFFASNGFNGSAYLICVTGTGVTCTYPTNAFPASGLEIGGTSASTPAMAGVMALINQKMGNPQGNPAPEMYKLASQQNYGNCATATVTNSSSCYFNDITTGTISMPCDNGLLQTGTSPDCTVTVAANKVGVLSGFSSGVAYDRATGLGSMNVANVVNAWTAFVGPGASTVTVTPSSGTIAWTSPLTVNVIVNGSATLGNPTGTVTLSRGSYTSSAKSVTASGTANATVSFNVPANTLDTGSTALTATYSGDDNYAKQTGTASLTVNPPFTLAAADVSIPAGASTGTSDVTVHPLGGYTGTVNLTAAVTSSPSGAVSPPTVTGSSVSITSATDQHGTITIATTPVTAVRTRAPGLAWFRAAEGTALAGFLLFFLPLGSRRGRKYLSAFLLLVAATFTVVGCGGGGHSKSTPTVTVTPSKTAFSSDTAITVAVSVSGSSQAATGTVTLSGGGFTSSTASLSNGAATINIPANSLSKGSVTLTATYSGDSNYNSGSGSSSVTVNAPSTTKGAYVITVTGTDTAHANVTSTTTFNLTVN